VSYLGCYLQVYSVRRNLQQLTLEFVWDEFLVTAINWIQESVAKLSQYITDG